MAVHVARVARSELQAVGGVREVPDTRPARSFHRRGSSRYASVVQNWKHPSTSWQHIGRILPTDTARIDIVNGHFPDTSLSSRLGDSPADQAAERSAGQALGSTLLSIAVTIKVPLALSRCTSWNKSTSLARRSGKDRMQPRQPDDMPVCLSRFGSHSTRPVTIRSRMGLFMHQRALGWVSYQLP